MIDKTKLGLHLPTDPRWVNLAEMSLEYILTDHAFCEQKAATACISLIQQYPDKKELVKALMPVVTDMSLGFQRKDEYVNALQKFRKHGNRDVNLIESLLICALIEARSCERFRLLSLHISEESLKQFYYDLMVSEAGHYKMFLELAIHYGGEGMVRKRWQEYLVFEAEVMKKLTADGTRIH